MKVYLINPAPIKIDDDKTETLFYASAPPLGLMYIAANLSDLSHEVSIMDQAAVNYTNQKVIDWVKKGDPDLIGFSSLCASFENAKIMSNELKKWNPNLKIVFGNYLATFYAKKILERYKWVDFCVRGEGEITFRELLECLEKNHDLSRVDGISYRSNGSIRENKNREILKNLDFLKFPARELVKVEYRNRMAGIDFTNRKFTTMVSSRGCPFGCTFCSCTAFSEGRWRTRSIDNIIEELSILASQGYREILFVDDNFTLSDKRVMEFSEKFRKENLDMTFVCDGRVNKSSISLFRTMKRSNFEILMFGIESGNQRILDLYNKKITPEMSKIAVKNARRAGFKFLIGSFMIGGYNETYEEALTTLDFISKLDIDFPHIIFPRALPGTQLFNNLLKREIIDEEKYWETGVDLIDLPNSKMEREVIFKILKEQFHIFFFRPQYLIRAILRTIRSKYRREVIFNHLNFGDFDKFIKLMNNPPDLF